MTHPTPSPAEFLAQQEPDEPDEYEDSYPEPSDPLTSIAASLQAIASVVVNHDAGDQADNELRELYDNLDTAYADLEAKYEAISGLVDDVLEVCKPSVSKLANQVRDTITQWRSPAVVEEAKPEPEPEP